MSALLSARAAGCLAGRGGFLLILSAALLWGTVGVTTRGVFTVAETTALSVAFLRLALAFPVLGMASAVLLGRRAFSIAPRDALVMAGLGIMLASYQLCYFGAIRRVGVAVATLVTPCSAPVIVAVLSTVLLRERLTRRVVLAATLAICGTAMLVTPAEGSHSDSSTLVGLLLAPGSGTGYALLTIGSRTVAHRYHPLTPMTVGFAVGAAVLLPALLLDGPRLDFPTVGWALLIYLGVMPTAFAYVLFTIGMRTTVATVASLITLIEPLTSAALAWLIFDEQLGPLALVGALVLLGAVLVLARE